MVASGGVGFELFGLGWNAAVAMGQGLTAAESLGQSLTVG